MKDAQMDSKSGLKISLRAARVNAGLRLVDAAKKLGVGKDRLARWEKDPGVMEVRYQQKLSELYNVPVESFFLGVLPD